MKIIDILNKMANGELEDGFRFRFNEEVFYYDKDRNRIVNKNMFALTEIYTIETYLDDEVVVIVNKECREIRELEEYDAGYIIYNEVDIELNRKKINELIRAVNKLSKN